MPVSSQSIYGLSQPGSAAASSSSQPNVLLGHELLSTSAPWTWRPRVTGSVSIKLEPAQDEILGVAGMKVLAQLNSKLDRYFSFEDQQYLWFETKNRSLVTSVLSNVMNEQVQALAHLIHQAIEDQLACVLPSIRGDQMERARHEHCCRIDQWFETRRSNVGRRS
jgi:hypothetical protein